MPLRSLHGSFKAVQDTEASTIIVSNKSITVLMPDTRKSWGVCIVDLFL